jgi:hypothetical protein
MAAITTSKQRTLAILEPYDVAALRRFADAVSANILFDRDGVVKDEAHEGLALIVAILDGGVDL